MKKALLAYVISLLVLLVLDGLWLGVLMAPTYRALLGPLMLDQPLLVVAVQHLEGLRQLGFLPVQAQQAVREAV